MVKIRALLIAIFVFVLVPFFAQATTISMSPANASFAVGDRIIIKIVVDGQTPINAASVTATFPVSIFSIDSVSKADSILDFWVSEPTFSKATGVVKFEGVALGGFTGKSGTLLTVRLRAIKAGTAQATFQLGQIFANDGQGTDVTSGLYGASFSVTPAPSAPPTPLPPPPVEEEPVELPQPLPTLTAPEIMLGAKYGAPAIIGTSQYPYADALVTFIAQDGAKIFISHIADEKGEFTVLIPSSLKRGVYAVSAVMVKQDKSNSSVSNPITITVGSIWADLGLNGIIAIAIVLCLIIFLAWRAFHRIRASRPAALAKEVKEAKTAVRKSFDSLRDDVYAYEVNQKNKTLEERIAAAHLKKDLDAAERSISREIDDIK